MEEIWIFWNCLQAHIFKACRTKISGHFPSMEVKVVTWHQVRSDLGRMIKIQPMYQYLRVNCYSPMKHVWPYSMKNLSKLQSCQWLVAEIWRNKTLVSQWWPPVTFFMAMLFHICHETKVTWCNKVNFLWISKFKILEFAVFCNVTSFHFKWFHIPGKVHI